MLFGSLQHADMKNNQWKQWENCGLGNSGLRVLWTVFMILQWYVRFDACLFRMVYFCVQQSKEMNWVLTEL